MPVPIFSQTLSLLPPDVHPLVMVDDEMMVRSVCTRILQTRFLVFEANSSHDALALADLIPFPLPLLVTDISLPRMDGITLAHIWLKRHRDARVLLLSGNSFAANFAPDIGFLQKPFVADELLGAMQELSAGAEKVATR